MATPHQSLVNAQRDAPFPPRPGTYALLLRMEGDSILTVGRLGRFRFPAGVYVYLGSARGPGGLAARLARHLRNPKPSRWHVDYLRAHAQPMLVWFAEGERRRECAWVAAVAELPGATVPAPGFGASDCRCPAHLVYLPAQPGRGLLARAVGEPVAEVRLDG